MGLLVALSLLKTLVLHLAGADKRFDACEAPPFRPDLHAGLLPRRDMALPEAAGVNSHQ